MFATVNIVGRQKKCDQWLVCSYKKPESPYLRGGISTVDLLVPMTCYGNLTLKTVLILFILFYKCSQQWKKMWSMVGLFILVAREPLLKGKDQYSWTPCTNVILCQHDMKNSLYPFHYFLQMFETANIVRRQKIKMWSMAGLFMRKAREPLL